MSRILGLILGRTLLGIGNLRRNTISFVLRLRVLGLGEHIPDCEGVLRRLILHWRLSFLTHTRPLKNFGIRKGGQGRKELLRKRVRLEDFLNILGEEDVFGPP